MSDDDKLILSEEEAAKAQQLADAIGLGTTWKWDAVRDGIDFHTEIHLKMFIGFDSIDEALTMSKKLRDVTREQLRYRIEEG